MTALLLLACVAPAPPRAVADGLSVAPAPEAGNAWSLTWSAPPGAEARVELSDASGEPIGALPAEVRDGVGRAVVIGPVPGEPIRARVWVGDAPGPEVSWTPPAPPEEVRALLIAPGADPEALAGGAALLAVVSEEASSVVVVDALGRPRWWVVADPTRTFAAPRPTRDGRGVLLLELDRARDSDDGRAVTVAWDGSERREVSLPGAHHMVAELDEGELAWLAWDVREVPWEGGAVQPVLADRVLVGRGDGDARALLSFFDDRGPPYVPCAHGLLPDQRLGLDLFEWTHANSLVWDEATDSLTLVARLLDAVIRLDRRTGEVLWQVGGRDATLTWEGGDPGFSHGHASDVWADGALLFDNGSHREPQASRVLEVAFAPEDGAVSVVGILDDPLGRFVPYLGDARRMPGGGLLISDSPAGTVREVGPDGRARWWGVTERGEVPGRIDWLPAWPPEPR